MIAQFVVVEITRISSAIIGSDPLFALRERKELQSPCILGPMIAA
jgi:hypothetical protein